MVQRPGEATASDRRVRSLLDLFEHGAEQLGLVLEVVIERTAGAHAGPGDQVADAGVEVALLTNSARPASTRSRRVCVAACPTFVVGATSLRHADHRSNLHVVCCGYGRRRGSRIRFGGAVESWLAQRLSDEGRHRQRHPRRPAAGLRRSGRRRALSIGRSSWWSATSSGCPTVPTTPSSRPTTNWSRRVAWRSSGRMSPTTWCRWRAHVDRVAKVPNIILSGSEGALGEWCFALNNGSMPEEPVMLAAVMLGDGRSRIAIAYEASLIGKEYLAFAEKAYAAAGLKVVTTVAIPQVEADKSEAVKAAARRRARRLGARRVRARAVGLHVTHCWPPDWDPPRYTTTAFEMAHINAEWMRHLSRLDRAGQLRRTQRGGAGVPGPVRGALRPPAGTLDARPVLTTSATVIVRGLGGGAPADR